MNIAYGVIIDVKRAHNSKQYKSTYAIQTDASFINRFGFIGVCHLKDQINLLSHRSQFVLEFIIQQLLI